MSNGIQTNGNVKLTVVPVLVAGKDIFGADIFYVLLAHILKNTGSTAVTGQKFGAAADIQIYGNDTAPLKLTSYGIQLTDPGSNLRLAFYAKTGTAVTSADTLWIGKYTGNSGGSYYNAHVYDDGSSNYTDGDDCAIAFSWQNIELQPGEFKVYMVRMAVGEDRGGAIDAIIY
jgi:hypothetical protein